jgi:hypothetical protein
MAGEDRRMGAVAEPCEALEARIADAFDILAWEIELAGARCIQLDSVIGQMVKQLPESGQGRLLESLHAVDLLSQHLTGLSAFARALSSSLPPDLRAPMSAALAQVTLGALADRISGALGGAEKDINDGEDAGDLDLF